MSIQSKEQFEKEVKEEFEKTKKINDDKFLMEKAAIAKQRKLDKEAAARAFNDQVEDHLKELHTSRDGKPVSPWETVEGLAKNALDGETNAYNSEWKIAMLKMMADYSKLALAIHSDIYPYLKQFQHAIGSTLSDIGAGIEDSLKKQELGSTVLPAIMHSVKVSEGKLDVNLAIKGIPATEQVEKLFTSMVHDWLKENQYKREADNKFYNEQGELLTQDNMNELPSFSDYLNDNNPSLTYKASM